MAACVFLCLANTNIEFPFIIIIIIVITKDGQSIKDKEGPSMSLLLLSYYLIFTQCIGTSSSLFRQTLIQINVTLSNAAINTIKGYVLATTGMCGHGR